MNSAKPTQKELNDLIQFYQTGRYVDAEKISLTITQKFPKHPFAWKVLAAILKQKNKISESLVASQKCVQLEPLDSEAHNNLGNTLRILGRLDEAETSLKQAILLKPDYAEAHNNLGVTLIELKKLKEAEASYRQAILLKPNYASAHYNLGNLLREKGRLKEAESSYRQAILLKPNYAEAHDNLDFVLRRKELLMNISEAKKREKSRLENAEASLRQAIALKPDYAEAHYNLGITLKELRRLEESEASYRKAIKLKPDFAEAHSNLGVILKELNRLKEAEASYKKAIALKPDLVEAHHNLGNTLQGLGRLDEAEASYRKAIELKPDYTSAHYNLGVILQGMGKLEEAEASYRKAIALKPDYSEAHYNLDLLLRRKELLVNISEAKKDEIKNNLKSVNVSSVSSDLRLSSNPFISKREVEKELFTDLYKMKTGEFDKTKDARYGNGKCSDFKFFENELPIIKNMAEDLKKIMMQAVKSEIFILDSFFNIYEAGAKSGTTTHYHIDHFDKSQGLVDQKYSLTYYLSVGDQNCSEPGNLKVYDPEEEILVSEGKIVIIPASRKHAAIYNGKKDRIMVGVNFYSLL